MSDAPGKDPETGRFLPGNTGFGGRPKGARNKLGEQFLADLHSIWSKQGEEVLQRAVTEDPMGFARMVAGLLPKELLVVTRPTDDLTDAELADRLEQVEGFIALLRGSGEGPRPTH